MYETSGLLERGCASGQDVAARTKTADMSRYVMYAAGPDHCQIAQCDSDVTDVRDVLTKAAVLTGDGRCRFAGFGPWTLTAPGFWGGMESAHMGGRSRGGRSLVPSRRGFREHLCEEQLV